MNREKVVTIGQHVKQSCRAVANSTASQGQFDGQTVEQEMSVCIFISFCLAHVNNM